MRRLLELVLLFLALAACDDVVGLPRPIHDEVRALTVVAPRAGDCNADGILDFLDYVAMRRIGVGVDPRPTSHRACDVNLDGRTDVLDAVEFVKIPVRLVVTISYP